MKKQSIIFIYTLFLFLLSIQGNADELTNSDSKILSPQEAKIFFGAVCDHGEVITGKENGETTQSCKSVMNYPKGSCSASIGQGLQIGHVIYGSFSAASAKEAVVDYDGCEAHGDMYGGSIILRQAGIGWKVLGFLPGFRSKTCLKFSQPNAKDTLICLSSTFLTGTEIATINALSILNGKLSESPILLTQKPDSSQICSTGKKSEMTSITQWKNVTANGKQFLTIEGEYLSEPPPKECSYDVSKLNAKGFDELIGKLEAWITKNTKPYKISFEIKNNRIVISGKDKPVKFLLDQIGNRIDGF